LKRTLIFSIILIFFIPNATLISSTLPGSELYYLGPGSRQIALGGAGTTIQDNVSSVFFNPAALAENKQFKFGISYGNLNGGDIFANSGISYLTPRGVISFNAIFSKTAEINQYETGIGGILNFSFSKIILPGFLFGLGFNIPATQFANDDRFSMGISLNTGFIIKQEFEKGANFGFHNPKFSFSLMNLGIPLKESGYRNFPDNQAKAGFSFDYYRSKKLQLSLLTDITLPFSDFFVRGNIGMEIKIFDILHLRAGVIINNIGAGPFSFGGSLYPKRIAGDNKFEIGYSFLPTNFNGKPENIHSLSVNLSLGNLDKEPPKITITPDNKHFSPNGDGIKDKVIFDFNIDENRILQEWSFKIYPATKTNESSLKIKKVTENPHKLTIPYFFKRIFAKNSPVIVPEKITWDGLKLNGRPVPDGKYCYEATAMDKSGNRSFSGVGTLIIKTSKPQISLSITNKLFSPNGDKRKEKTTFFHKTKDNASWQGIIKNKNNITVKKWLWKNKPIAEKHWDGRDNKNKLLPDGKYKYIIRGIDKAGNKIEKYIKGITISSTILPIQVSARPQAFSPNDDYILDKIFFYPNIKKTDLFEKWQLSIFDKNKNTIKRINGKRHIPSQILYNGKNSYGRALSDGNYFYTIKGFYKDGNQPISLKKEFRVDTTPPEIDMNISPKFFSPDKDGHNDKLRIEVKIRDKSTIDSWKIRIVKDKKIFKTFTSKNNPKNSFTLHWDGKGDDGTIVQSASFYKIKIEATDSLGNKSNEKEETIIVDILIIKTLRGMKIRVSNIEFTFDKWELKKPDNPILNRVADILKRYSRYKVIIEGHTDKVGRADYNLMLSTRRARTVLKYLVRRGIDEDRLLAKGLGKSVPLKGNRNSKQNRRVEFILVRGE